jgi:hypothetical protein
LCDCVIDDACRTFVVKLERGGALWVTEFGECCSNGDSIFGIDETGAGFSFLEENADDFLDVLALGWSQWRMISQRCKLLFLSIFWRRPFVWGMLRETWWGMFETS